MDIAALELLVDAIMLDKPPEEASPNFMAHLSLVCKEGPISISQPAENLITAVVKKKRPLSEATETLRPEDLQFPVKKIHPAYVVHDLIVDNIRDLFIFLHPENYKTSQDKKIPTPRVVNIYHYEVDSIQSFLEKQNNYPFDDFKNNPAKLDSINFGEVFSRTNKAAFVFATNFNGLMLKSGDKSIWNIEVYDTPYGQDLNGEFNFSHAKYGFPEDKVWFSDGLSEEYDHINETYCSLKSYLIGGEQLSNPYTMTRCTPFWSLLRNLSDQKQYKRTHEILHDLEVPESYITLFNLILASYKKQIDIIAEVNRLYITLLRMNKDNKDRLKRLHSMGSNGLYLKLVTYAIIGLRVPYKINTISVDGTLRCDAPLKYILKEKDKIESLYAYYPLGKTLFNPPLSPLSDRWKAEIDARPVLKHSKYDILDKCFSYCGLWKLVAFPCLKSNVCSDLAIVMTPNRCPIKEMAKYTLHSFHEHVYQKYPGGVPKIMVSPPGPLPRKNHLRRNTKMEYPAVHFTMFPYSFSNV